MTIRATRASITFNAPFQLPGFDQLPAGTYDIDTDEQAFEGNVRTVYQRVATTLRIPIGTGFENHPVDPKHLEEALERDQGIALAMHATPSSSIDNAEAAPTAPAIWRWVPLWVRTSLNDRKN